ncbi:MAG: sugar phosphate isomerase/epimerase family protein [Bacillota bacterium]
MKYGQEFRFGYDGDPKEKMKMIADAGFDGIMTWWGHRFSRRDGSRESVALNARDCGLQLFAFHSSYQDVSDIWGSDSRAKKILDRHIANLEDCDKFGCRNLVVHVSGVDAMPTNLDAGLENYAKLFNRGKQLGVNVAMENVSFTCLNRLLIENLNSPAHKSCYDSGHDNYMSDVGDDVLSLFAGRIAVTHLHDNYKNERKDSHFLIGDGDVDFKRVVSVLKKENLEAICLESRNSKQSKYANLSPQDFLAKSLENVKGVFGC